MEGLELEAGVELERHCSTINPVVLYPSGHEGKVPRYLGTVT